MTYRKKSEFAPINIQLLADGAAASGAAAPGGTAVAGQNIDTGAGKRANQSGSVPDGVSPTPQQRQKPTWQELMRDPEYNAEMQKVVSRRVNAMKQPRRSEAELRSHFDGLQRQSAEMQQRFADFDLQRELDNPLFLKLTGPDVGLSVEDAYMAVHHREMTRAVTEGMKRELSNAIRAGAARPEEHGLGARSAAVTGFDYRSADRSQRRAFKREIYNAAARGEKIYPVN